MKVDRQGEAIRIEISADELRLLRRALERASCDPDSAIGAAAERALAAWPEAD